MTGRRGQIKVDYWTPQNTGAKYPNPNGVLTNDNPKYLSTMSYFDGTYLKIRNISLGYNFNQSLLKDTGVNMRMYFTVQNPFVMFSEFKRKWEWILRPTHMVTRMLQQGLQQPYPDGRL